MWRVWMLLCLLLCASGAYAGPKEEAQAKKKQGEKLLEEGNYQEALDAFEEAKKLNNKDLSIELALANALLKLRKFEEAKASYQLFLDSGKASKPDQKKIKDAIRSIESTLKTSVLCQSDPAGAQVYLNSLVDGLVGETPITFNLPPGEHRIFFQREGFQTKTEKLSIAEGDKASLQTKLSGLPFTASITSDPAGAEVFIAGASRGVTPLTTELEAGKHEVTFTLAGYADTKVTIEGEAGKKVSLAKSLSSSPGVLQFAIKPARAQVKIEGRDEVFAANGSVQLPNGEYTVIASALGYEERRLTAVSTAGKSETIEVALQPKEGLFLLRSTPDVTFSLNGEPQRQNELLSLPPGTYPIQIDSPGKSPYKGEISLALGQVLEVTPTLSDAPKLTSRRWLLASGGALAPWLVVYPVYLSSRLSSNDNDLKKWQDVVHDVTAIASPVLLTSAVSALVFSRLAKKKETSSTMKTNTIKELP